MPTIDHPAAVQAAQEARDLCNLYTAIEARAYDWAILRWEAQGLADVVPATSDPIADAQTTTGAAPITADDVRAVRAIAVQIIQSMTPEQKALVNRLRTYRVGG